MNEELIALLQGASGMGEQDQALALQAAQAARLRQQASAPRQFTSPGAALGGGLARIIQGYGAGQTEQAVTQGRAALGTQRKQILSNLPSFDDYSSPADVSAQDSDTAADALTRNTGSRVNLQRSLARALAATGDTTLSALGGDYGKEAVDLEKGLETAVSKREDRALRRALGDQRAAVDQTKLDVALEKAGLDAKTRLDVARIVSESKDHYQFVPIEGGFLSGNKRTGAANAVTFEDGTVPRPAGKGGSDKVDPQWLHLVDRIIPETAGARTTLGATAGILRQIQATTAVWQPGQVLTPQQVKELGLGIAKTIGGNVTHRATIDELSANSLGIDATRLVQYLTGRPQDAKAQEWALHFLSVLKREEAQAKVTLRGVAEKYLAGYQGVVRKSRSAADSLFPLLGISKEELDQMVGQGAPPATAAPAPRPPARPTAAGLSPPRADGKVRIKRGGQTGLILPADIKPGDERI